MAYGMEHILSDLRVLDLTRALAGPSCTRMLAEMGADVIKVESAPRGDMVRGMSVFEKERSLYFIQQNLGKKSLCVNIRDPKAMDIIKELVAEMDVVVENFKPGVIAQMGLGYEDLKKIKPDIILCSISALGQKGPLSTKPGYDYIAQAYSGVTSMIGDPDEAPYLPLVGMGDVSTGVHAALAVVSALRYRDRTGEGQHLDIGLLDVYYHYHEVNVHQYSSTKGKMNPTRGRPAFNLRLSGGHLSGQGRLACHHGLSASLEGPVCRHGETGSWWNHERYGTEALRLEHRDEVVEIIEGWLQATFSRC